MIPWLQCNTTFVPQVTINHNDIILINTHLSTPQCTFVADAFGASGAIDRQFFMMLLTSVRHRHIANGMLSLITTHVWLAMSSCFIFNMETDQDSYNKPRL